MNKTAAERPGVRIGRIDYTNVWPVFFHFPEHLLEEVEIVQAVPTTLNRAMAEGSIHLGPISSFGYAEHYEQYEIFPDLSVSCYGAVHSILLFHKKPLEELRFGKFALPTTSATSVNLLKIIMEKFLEGRPEYVYCAPKLDDMLRQADAALLIGDDAIRASWTRRDVMVTDLGQKWAELTGRWMTFAVWAVRKDAIERWPGVIQSVYQAFQRSKRIGLKNPRPIAERAVAEIGGSLTYWMHYFTNLNHDFGEPQQAGLSLYYRYAHELGLLPRSVPIQLWTNHTVA